MMSNETRRATIAALGLIEVVELIGGPCDGMLQSIAFGVFDEITDDCVALYKGGVYRRRAGVDHWSARLPTYEPVQLPEGACPALFDWEPE